MGGATRPKLGSANVTDLYRDHQIQQTYCRQVSRAEYHTLTAD